MMWWLHICLLLLMIPRLLHRIFEVENGVYIIAIVADCEVMENCWQDIRDEVFHGRLTHDRPPNCGSRQTGWGGVMSSYPSRVGRFNPIRKVVFIRTRSRFSKSQLTRWDTMYMHASLASPGDG